MAPSDTCMSDLNITFYLSRYLRVYTISVWFLLTKINTSLAFRVFVISSIKDVNGTAVAYTYDGAMSP